jgi:hypothetical protein
MRPFLQHLGTRLESRLEVALISPANPLARILEVRELAQELQEERVGFTVQSELLTADAL